MEFERLLRKLLMPWEDHPRPRGRPQFHFCNGLSIDLSNAEVDITMWRLVAAMHGLKIPQRKQTQKAQLYVGFTGSASFTTFATFIAFPTILATNATPSTSCSVPNYSTLYQPLPCSSPQSFIFPDLADLNCPAIVFPSSSQHPKKLTRPPSLRCQISHLLPISASILLLCLLRSRFL
jgi:hypothetical protein